MSFQVAETLPIIESYENTMEECLEWHKIVQWKFIDLMNLQYK